MYLLFEVLDAGLADPVLAFVIIVAFWSCLTICKSRSGIHSDNLGQSFAGVIEDWGKLRADKE